MPAAAQPEGIERAIEAPVDTAIETASSHVTIGADGATHAAPIWFAVGGGRAHLVALHDTPFVVSTGDPAAVKTNGSLMKDTLSVAEQTVKLQRKTKAEVDASIERFAERADGTAFVPAPGTARGTVLEHAVGVPDWWADTVGGDDDDPWLYAIQTSSSWPVLSVDGDQNDARIWIGVSMNRTVAAARRDERALVFEVPGALQHVEKIGKDEVRADAFRASLADADAERIADLSAEDGPARLARLVRHTLRRGLCAATDAYLRALVDTGPARIGAVLSMVAYECGAPDDALALLRTSDRVPAIDEVRRSKVRERVRKGSDEERGALLAAIRRFDTPAAEPPRDFPWPPACIETLWAAGVADDVPRAKKILEALEEPRRRHARLAIGDATADEWRDVAQAYADLREFAWARRLLARAIATDGDARDHLNDAAWAYKDDRPTEAGAAFERALDLGIGDSDVEALAALLPVDAPPPTEGLLDSITKLVRSSDAAVSPDAFEAFARTAAAHGDGRIAARLLVEREHKSPSASEAVEAAAKRCAVELGAPREAALLLELLARRIDAEDSDEPVEPQTARLWLEAATLRATAGDAEIAAANLRSALGIEFLRPANYRTALAVEGTALTPAQRTWWSHLHAVLDGDTVGAAPLEGVPSLDASTLDRLHPGGGGWLDGLRSAIQEAEPPTRVTLTRGLERLSRDLYADAGQTIDHLCVALDVGHPESFVYRGDDAYGVCVWPIASPILLVGYQHLDDTHPRHLSALALRFALAVELTHLACRHPILSFESDLFGTSHSAYQTFGKYAGTAETLVDVVTMLPGVDQVAKLQRVVRITKRVFSTKSAIDKVAGLAAPLKKYLPKDETTTGIGREKLEGAALQFRVQADRSALLLTGDFAAAVEAILKTGGGLEQLGRVRSEGLSAVLEDGALPPADALRLSALAGFAAQEMP